MGLPFSDNMLVDSDKFIDNSEPILSEILKDDVVQILMKSDGIRMKTLEDIIENIRGKL